MGALTLAWAGLKGAGASGRDMGRNAMITRRKALGGAAGLAGLGLAGGCTPSRPGAGFITATDGKLWNGAAPYRFVGANLWFGAYLGARTAYGDPARLTRELDRLAGAGVRNLRVLGGSELSPLTNSITPAFRTESDAYNEDLLKGLDLLLAEMAARDMRAVIYLTNFWEWSGGMMTYLYWTNGGRYINMNDPAHPWPQFPDFNAAFYQSKAAIALYHHYVRALVGRTNSVTGRAYADDPTIMSWQLANEPRPGGTDAIGGANLPNFYAWINETAALIKSLDANHLVSTGSEGVRGCMERSDCVIASHEGPNIDYLTAHIWPQNWSWIDPRDIEGTFANAEAHTRAYISEHIALAGQLGKPLVIEEFGFPREAESFDAAAPTTHRDRFYKIIYDAVEESVAQNGPLAGSNFWAWGGEGRAAHADWRFAVGDTSYMGDPPHEPQGWYSVLDGDDSTLALISAHAEALRA